MIAGSSRGQKHNHLGQADEAEVIEEIDVTIDPPPADDNEPEP